MKSDNIDLTKTNIPKWNQKILKDQPKEIIKLIDEYYEKQNKVQNTRKRLLQEENEVKEHQDKIQKICKHKWEYEPPVYQERSSYYCSICYAYK